MESARPCSCGASHNVTTSDLADQPRELGFHPGLHDPSSLVRVKEAPPPSTSDAILCITDHDGCKQPHPWLKLPRPEAKASIRIRRTALQPNQAKLRAAGSGIYRPPFDKATSGAPSTLHHPRTAQIIIMEALKMDDLCADLRQPGFVNLVVSM